MTVNNISLHVKGMSCNHCVKSIEAALGKIQGIESVQVNLKKESVSVSFRESNITIEKIKETIEDAGYDVVS